jgi:aryl-alcohol dehydrogenase-like predicted oxidoreductase
VGPPGDPDNAVAVLRRAIEPGVTFIDTPDSYGPGDNERIIRQALPPTPMTW